MRLKQIKLAGFKSFVDPTTVTLPGNRCAVVGPNGCGKSNIIDAVRWVMGESSAKQLRGENLTDVIFNGSNTRKPNAAASIELTFDNSDGRIGGEYAAYTDIAIRREVSRDGQSSYILNGSRARRRDIQDIFLGTGFGPRSYSIIEQGMISQLVEAKPEELRAYLEEAAGISKYKERRRETENRIRHSRENLERVNDIREELGRQLDRLQRQAQAAERYRGLKQEESLLHAQLYALQHKRVRVELDQAERVILERQTALEGKVAEQRSLEADIEGGRSQLSLKTEEFNEVQAKYYGFGTEITRTEESLAFNRQRMQQLQEELTQVERRREEANQQVALDDQQILTMQTNISEIQPDVEARAQADASTQAALSEVEEQHRGWQQRWDAFNQQQAANQRQSDAEQSKLEYLEQLVQRIDLRSKELEQQHQAQPPEQGQLVEQMALEINDLEDASEVLKRQISESISQLTAKRSEIAAKETELDGARTAVQDLRHQLAGLQATQDAALRGHVQEAEAWITSNGLSQARRLGENLAVAPGWETAVEAVLGRFMQALHVERLDDFAETLMELADGDLALIEASTQNGSDAHNDAVDLPPLNSLLRSKSNVASSLLYGVFAAESAAVALANRPHLQVGQSIVTREGFWLGVDWIRVLHDSDQMAGIIERGQQLENLNLQVEDAESGLNEVVAEQHRLREEAEQLERRRDEFQGRANELNASLSSRRMDHGVTRVKLEEATVRQRQLAAEATDLARQRTQEVARIEQAKAALAEVRLTEERLEAQNKLLVEERDGLQRALQERRDEARSSRERFHEANLQLESLQSQLAVSLTARQRMQQQRQALVEQVERIQTGIQESTKPLPELQENLQQLLSDRGEQETTLAKVREETQAFEAAIKSLEAERSKVVEDLSNIRDGLEQLRVRRQGMSVEEANFLSQLSNTGHALEEINETMPEEANETVWMEEIERMQRRIQRLGAINLAAIDGFQQESERKQFLDAQAEDLELALATLQDAMQKIDRETKVRFKETFDAVNVKLGELFPKVFGGGSAYLELTGDDLLDTGVSLMARPPGKRNASVQLLSGGEKAMTAVALIFAIFHLNPSPVCLLDEVDAPLDDMNVSRFAVLIKEMSESVQFLVITHNKITMEMADYLMGVTMQEPGVSRLVSVDVDAAAELAIA